MENQVQKDEVEIDLLELAHVLWRKWWAIFLCMVIGVVVAFGGTKFLMTPKYTASSMIYILSERTEATTMSDVQIGASLAQDFIILGKSRPVVEPVIEKLNLDMTYGEVVEEIGIENPDGSHILKISVTDPDAELAADISNEIAEAMKKQIAEVMGTDLPNSVEEASVPEEPSSPNTMKNVLLGGLLGAVLAAAAIILLYVLDDTIKNEDDVKRYLQLNTLAALPVEKRAGVAKSKKVR